jgi:hypothetical protein
MDYVSCDEIIATKGDLIAFRRVRCWCIAYCHFAVFTESADSEIIIPEKIGDRYELLANIYRWTSSHHGFFTPFILAESL